MTKLVGAAGAQDNVDTVHTKEDVENENPIGHKTIRKWRRVVQSDVDEANLTPEVVGFRRTVYERDKNGEQMTESELLEITKKRAVDFTQMQVAGTTPWALSEL